MKITVANIIETLKNPRFAVYTAAIKFILRHEGRSFKFNKNGEALLVNALPKDSTKIVFDVGANIGNWSKLALDALPEATIHSFELSSETFKTLHARFSENKRCTLNDRGLSNQEC